MSSRDGIDPVVSLRKMLLQFSRREANREPQASPVLLDILNLCLGQVAGASDLQGLTEEVAKDLTAPWVSSSDERLRRVPQRLKDLKLRERATSLNSAITNRKSDVDAIAAQVGGLFDDLAGWLHQIAEIPSSLAGGPDSLLARPFAFELVEAADRLRFNELPNLRPNGPQDWFPLVSARPSTHGPLTISAWTEQENLVNRLAGGAKGRALVPFLGPGVSQAQADPSEVIEDASTAFNDSPNGDREFHAALVAQRRGRRQLLADGWIEIQGLAELRRALISSARLGSMLVACCEVVSPIADWDRYEVGLKGESLVEFVAALSTAAEAAISVANGTDGDEADPDLRLLGASAIAVRLNRLLDDVQTAGSEPRVMGAEVNWLTDCAWHSLIFRSPIYPSVRELALQVELCSAAGGAGPVRRLEPTEAIARRTLNSLTGHTRRAVLRGFRPSRVSGTLSRGRLHDALARRLWQESTESISHPPLAVSMTFDLEMERGLLATRPAGEAFHVLVPTLNYQPNERMSLRWILGTYPPMEPSDKDGSDALGVLRTPSWSGGEPAPRGPVVVKLNGSPLHRLPRFGSQRIHALPALLLRELDSLDIGSVSLVANALQRSTEALNLSGSSQDAPAPSQAMPKWVLSKIAPARQSEESSLLLVIGARWSDWSSRSQLFGLLSLPGTNADRLLADRAFAVAEAVDPDRAHLLNWLFVQLVIGDCLDLIPQLEDLVR